MTSAEIISIAGVMLVLIGWLAKLTWMFAQLSIQVTTMWEKHIQTWLFLTQRGSLEVEGKGFGKRESPITIDESDKKDLILEVYAPVIPYIEEIVDTVEGDLSKEEDDVKFFEAVGTKLSKVLADSVCKKLGVNEGGCVALALAVVRHKRGCKIKKQPENK